MLGLRYRVRHMTVKGHVLCVHVHITFNVFFSDEEDYASQLNFQHSYYMLYLFFLNQLSVKGKQ